MPDLQDPTVTVQEDPAALSTNGERTVDQDTSNGETTSVQADGQTANGDGKTGTDSLPPELEETRKQLLRDYHAKTQKLAEDKLRFEREMEGLKTHSNTLQQLMQQEWFKKAMEEERSRRNGGNPQDVQWTDEEFEAIKGDKESFKRAVLTLADRLVTGKVSPALNSVQQNQEELQTEREFEETASKYKDFKELNEKGAFDSYLEKGYDFAAAYKQYKFDTEFKELDSKIESKAQDILNKSREGSIAKSGVTQVNGQEIIKVHDLWDALDKGFDAEKRGKKYKFEKG